MTRRCGSPDLYPNTDGEGCPLGGGVSGAIEREGGTRPASRKRVSHGEACGIATRVASIRGSAFGSAPDSVGPPQPQLVTTLGTESVAGRRHVSTGSIAHVFAAGSHKAATSDGPALQQDFPALAIVGVAAAGRFPPQQERLAAPCRALLQQQVPAARDCSPQWQDELGIPSMGRRGNPSDEPRKVNNATHPATKRQLSHRRTIRTRRDTIGPQFPHNRVHPTESTQAVATSRQTMGRNG